MPDLFELLVESGLEMVAALSFIFREEPDIECKPGAFVIRNVF